MKITLKDIARMAEVSTATVSKIVNQKDKKISDKTRNKVLALIKEYNYVPNRVAASMVTKRTHSIGLLIPDIANPFFPELARGVEDLANHNGYHVILCNSDNDLAKEEAYFEMLQEKMVDGIIFTSSSRKRTVLRGLSRINVPIITVDRDIEGLKTQGKIIVDNESGAYDAVKYMISRGYKNILHLSGPLTSKPSRDRKQGYIRAFKEANLQINEDLLIEGHYTFDWGYKGINQIFNQGLSFDSVFCGNDLIALGALKAINEHGFEVPKDFGIVGFDDINMTMMIQPQLTTVHQPNYQMGYQAADMLIKIIEKKVVSNSNQILKTELIIRESVK